MVINRFHLSNILESNIQITRIKLLDIHLKAQNEAALEDVLEITWPHMWGQLCIIYASRDQDLDILKSLMQKVKGKLKQMGKEYYPSWLNHYGPSMMEDAIKFGAKSNAEYLSWKNIEQKKYVSTNTQEADFRNVELLKGISELTLIKEEMGDKELIKIIDNAQKHLIQGFEIAAQNKAKIKEAEEASHRLANEARELLKTNPIQFKDKMKEAQNAKALMATLKEDIMLQKLSIEMLISTFSLKNEYNAEIADSILQAILSTEDMDGYSKGNAFVHFCNVIYTIARVSSVDKVEYLLKAKDKIEEQEGKINNENKGNTYHNLGVSYKDHNIFQAIPYFEKSLECLGNDPETIEHLAAIYAVIRNEEKLSDIVSRHPDQDFQVIAKISYAIGNPAHFNEVLKIPMIQERWKTLKINFFDNNISKNLLDDCMIEEAFYNKDSEAIYNIATKMISITPLDTQGVLVKALNKIIDLGDIKIANKLLEKAEELAPDYAKQSIFVLNLGYEKLILKLKLDDIKEAENSFQEILDYKNKYPASFRAKSLLGLSAKKLLEAYVEKKEYSHAKNYLEYILEEDREKLTKYIAKLEKSESFQKISLYLENKLQDLLTEVAEEVLSEGRKEEAEAQKAAENIQEFKEAHESLPEKIEVLSYMLDSNQIDIDLLDPRYIEAYFKYKNAVSANQSVSDTIENINKWHSKSGTYQLSKGSNIVKLEIPHYYAMISPDLELSTSLNKKFKDALDTGRIAGKHNETGVKFCNGKFVELKIFGADGTGDQRLFTNKICINENGDYLIIFDTHGTHKNAPKSNSIEIYHSIQNGNSKHYEEMEAAAGIAKESKHPSYEYFHKAQSYYTEILGSDWLQSISSNESE